MRPVKTIGSITLFFILTGCAAFTPYKSDFTCPKTFNGRCVSTTTAYEASLDGTMKNGSKENDPKKGSSGNKDPNNDEEEAPSHSKKDSPEVTYFNALIDKLTGILKEPTAPVIAPPQVLRVLVLPYQGENATLYMPRYIYLIIDEPQWVLGNQLSEEGSESNRTKMGEQTFPLH